MIDHDPRHGPGGEVRRDLVKAEQRIAALEQAAAEQQRELDEARAEVERLRNACAKMNGEVCNTLGKALGYPWYKDDQKNFPGATEADGVCWGDHVAESIAVEAANKINALVKACGPLIEWGRRLGSTADDRMRVPDDWALFVLPMQKPRPHATAGDLRALVHAADEGGLMSDPFTQEDVAAVAEAIRSCDIDCTPFVIEEG